MNYFGIKCGFYIQKKYFWIELILEFRNKFNSKHGFYNLKSIFNSRIFRNYILILILRTCGYVVGCKNNKGGLTRHLSLVHQREYKMYTAKMEQNWTNGMLEKNLNMKVPANL